MASPATPAPSTAISKWAKPAGSPMPPAVDPNGQNVVDELTDKYCKEPALIQLADKTFWFAATAKAASRKLPSRVDLVKKYHASSAKKYVHASTLEDRNVGVVAAVVSSE